MPVYYEDKSLADEMLSGSKAAFDKIYKKYAPALLGYIIKAANDRQLSDHILEKAMTEIWERRSEYDITKERLLTWMIKIARPVTAAATGDQKKSIDPAILNSFACVYISYDSNDKKVVYEPKEGSRIQLYELYNTVIDLMHYQGNTVAQASEALNVNENKLKVMLKGAINKLKESNP